ncbi:zinc finger protein 292-like [Conger conger]|uniref:zinc finger protein 292-like n=1 Tax=Conger conger TaxID=82655 RepID=UPI002A5B0800|nr:zinc finger protein 292-like [Conger conger]
MADEETEREGGTKIGTDKMHLSLRERLQQLATALKDSPESPVRAATEYCQKFCQVLVEFAAQWKVDVDPWPLLEVNTEAILSYAEATPYLSSECENVSLILERLTLSCAELLLAQTELIPSGLWERFQSSVQTSHSLLQQNGNSQLRMLCALLKERGVWTNSTLCHILSNDMLQTEKVHEFLALEGPVLLELRMKQLKNSNHFEKAALLAKQCAEYPEFEGRANFMQTYLVCLCAAEPQEQLMQKISEVDCKDILEMVCNLESDGDDRGALCLCSTFLTRQILQSDVYCAWELTLFWSKLLKRVEPSAQVFLDRCRQLSRLSKSVYHILFLIKVVQAELQDEGLPVCIEMCIQALRMASSNEGNVKATICKTISCLLPTDLEVKRACQLTEFLLEPTVDSYYAVEVVYNEPDQKLDENNSPVPYSLRCELLLVFKTQWPFDPEYWDWKALKHHCLVLMGDQSSIVSSIDELNDCKSLDELDGDEEGGKSHDDFKDPTDYFLDTTNQLNEIEDERQKKREIKKLREKGFISARFRNWQAYVQYCVLCDKEFLGHRIVKHAQKHYSDGVYSCPICTTNFDSKEQLIPHVTLHVKQSCKERLTAMKASRVSATSKKNISDPSSNQKTESVIGVFEEEQSMEHFCPVTNCQKSFKFFRNMIAHVRTHGNNEEAKCFLEIQSKKVVCNYCRRQFVSIAHLNDHLQMHCSDKPYICVQLSCKARFLSNTELLLHGKEHTTFKAKCMFPDCGKIFTEAYMLYDHEARHYNTFTCKVSGCGKIFHAKSQLDLHQEDHVTKHLLTEAQTPVSMDVKTEPPTEILIDQEPNCPSMNTLLSNDEDHHLESAVQSVSSSTNEMVTLQASPIKIKHSVESMLNTASCSMQGVEQNLSLKVEPPAEHQQIPNALVQSSGNMYASYSEQPKLENLLPSQMGSQGQSGTLNRCVAQNLQAPSASDVPQSHAQNLVSFPTSDTSNPDFLPTQSLDWSCNHSQSEKNLQDPPLEWNRPVTSYSVSCKGDPLESSQHVSEDCYSYTGSGPANQSCTFDKPLVVQQIPPCMSNFNSVATKSVAATVISAQPAIGLVVSSKTLGNITHQSSCGPTAPKAAKERHYCQFETCSRNYSCAKSVNKHMKTVHPEFYIQWKLAKENSKVSKGPTRMRPIKMNKVSPAADTQSTMNQQMPYATCCRKNPPVSPGKFSENFFNAVLPSQPGQSHNEAVLNRTGPMQTDIANCPLLPLIIGNHSEISTQTTHPSECLPQELQSPASQVFPSEMTKSQAGYPSQTVCVHELGTVNPIYNGISGVGKTSAAHGTNSFVMTPICSGTLQSEIQADADLVNSVDKLPLLNNNGPAFQTNDSKGSIPIFQSPMDQGSQLSALLLGERSCPSHFSTSVHPDAPPLKMDEGLANVSSFNHTTLPNERAVARSMLVSTIKQKSQLVVPSGLQDPTGNLASPVLPLQLQSSSSSGLITSERIANSEMSLPSIEGDLLSRVDVESLDKSNISSQEATTQMKRARHSKRSKWPAILKDGKYICSRCFREFQSPKSLGGHLSKRSLCKDTNQTGLIGQVPPPLLDYKSPQTTDIYNQAAASNMNPNMHCKDQPGQLFSGAMEQVFSPNVTLTQSNPSVGEDGKDGESLQRFFDELPISSHSSFESSQFAQGTFHKPCESYTSDGLLAESTVIQHTGNLNFNTEKECCKEGFKSELQLDSSILSQSLPAVQVQNASLHNDHPTDYLNEILKAEALRKMRELSENDGTSQRFGLSNDTLLATITNLAQNLTRNPSPQLSTPDVQQLLLKLKSPLDFNQNPKCDQVKKELRDQILAGDILRRGDTCEEPVTDANTASEISGVPQVAERCQSAGNSVVIQKITECNAQSSSGGTTTVAPSQSEGTLPMQSAKQAEGSSMGCGNLVLGKCMTDNKDESPALSTGDEKVMEIMEALQRLDLDKKTFEDPSTADGCSPLNGSHCNEESPNNIDSLKLIDVNGTNRPYISENVSKPFLCEKEGCKYGAMTKEALFKHLSRVHGYTNDMIKELKKGPAKFAPYCCHLCEKTFTRTTNLRIHCESVHKLSREEFVKQKVYFRSKKMAVKDIPERESSNNQTGVCQMNPSCSQNVSLNYATSKIIMDKRHEPLDLASVQNTGHKQKAITQEYVSGSYKELTSTQQVTNASQSPNVQHASAAGQCLEKPPARVSVRLAAAVSSSSSSSLENIVPKPNQPKFVKSKIECPQKTKEKKDENHEMEDAFSPYRPYRCVHEGCMAAFTIQQNLILHYKAVHQSALPKFDMHTEDNDHSEDDSCEGEDEEARISEFRCQVKDCSRIFPQITGLLQHYLQLHEFSVNKASALMSSINFRRFQCDQQECTSSFSDFQRYIEHVEENHKVATMSKADGIEEIFRCEYSGCDRVYSTRSNVVRHIMNKHQNFYKLLMRKQKRREREQQASKKSKVAGVKTNGGKENRENQKHGQKGSNRKRNPRPRCHWTSFGKPSLKSREEASGLCTKKFALQYPCMLKGCDCVMSSERNVLRHYASHGLTERYIEEQRSGFIFCKKYSRSRLRDTEESEDDTTEISENDDVDEAGAEERETESSKRTCRKVESPELHEVKPLSNESTETKSTESVVIKRKRGRPRKVDSMERKIVASGSRRGSLRNGTNKVNRVGNRADRLGVVKGQKGQPEKTMSFSSFKPMGFEVSFLQFLEKSAEPTHPAKRIASEGLSNEMPSKRRRTLQQRTVNIICERPNLHRRAKGNQSLVDFRNPLKLKYVKNVKIVVDGTFSSGADLVMKQLQEMRPMVILKKWLYS